MLGNYKKGFSVIIDGSSTGENEILSPDEMLMNFIFVKCVDQYNFNIFMSDLLVYIAETNRAYKWQSPDFLMLFKKMKDLQFLVSVKSEKQKHKIQ